MIQLNKEKTMFDEYPDILNVPQLANALGIGRKAAYALVNENKIGHIRVGRNIKIPKYCLKEFLETARENIRL